MSHEFTSITESPGTLLSPEQYQRFLHRYAFGLRESGLLHGSVRLLEAGCGAGIGLAAWQEAVASRTVEVAFRAEEMVAGLEYVEPSLHVARANLGKVNPLLCGDAQTLPLANHTFDAIACYEVIYYLADIAAFLRECRRVLTAKGKVILCWSNPDWTAFVAGQHSLHYPTLGEMATLLAQAGFDKVQFYGAFATPQGSMKTRWVNRARQVAIRSGLVNKAGALTAPLMRAAYGELTPLPARLPLDEIVEYKCTLTPLEASVSDPTHRVLYAVAQSA